MYRDCNASRALTCRLNGEGAGRGHRTDPTGSGSATSACRSTRCFTSRRQRQRDPLWSVEQILRAGSCGALPSLRCRHLEVHSSETLRHGVRPLAAAQDLTSAVAAGAQTIRRWPDHRHRKTARCVVRPALGDCPSAYSGPALAAWVPLQAVRKKRLPESTTVVPSLSIA